MMDLFDLYQQGRINTVAATADQAAHDAKQAKDLLYEIKELEATIAKLKADK